MYLSNNFLNNKINTIGNPISVPNKIHRFCSNLQYQSAYYLHPMLLLITNDPLILANQIITKPSKKPNFIIITERA